MYTVEEKAVMQGAYATPSKLEDKSIKGYSELIMLMDETTMFVRIAFNLTDDYPEGHALDKK